MVLAYICSHSRIGVIETETKLYWFSDNFIETQT